jgi:type I restriction-modification system DNA methylase subunit
MQEPILEHATKKNRRQKREQGERIMAHVTEVHAYVHILKELTEKKGWKKEQIYTQNEYQNNKLLKELLGKGTPENIVEISPTQFYVIESKSTRLMVNQALREAKEDYAEKINTSPQIKAVFVTGIAGNEEEGYIASSQFLHNGSWKTITENESDVTSLLSVSEINDILLTNNPNLKDVELTDKEFFDAAEEINGTLHENAIPKDERARLMSAILLALSLKTELPLTGELPEIISQINTRVDMVLTREKKVDFARFIHIPLPSSSDNHIKWKTAIVKTIQALYGLNIHSAMKSGKDILGKFYEAFLKYGNGAKELGIVLTPRHITRFAAEVLDIQANDLVLDPTCGTGGFLVAAFDEIKREYETGNITERDFKKFKKWGLYGVENQDPIVALALVNMIFRGDGKNNIIEGDCFAKWYNSSTKEDDDLHESVSVASIQKEDSANRVPPITKVLMNPPFPKKKPDKKEYFFVEHALKQMQDDKVLFSVLPYSCMIKGGSYLSWRKTLIKEHTLLSVITFPPELFSPIGVRTIGVFIKKGIPHNNKKVLWLRAMHDGYRLKKGKRMKNPNEPDELTETIKPLLKRFLKDPNIDVEDILEFQKSAPLDPNDEELELCPEAYLDEKPVGQQEMDDRIEKLMRESIAFNIKFEKELESGK